MRQHSDLYDERSSERKSVAVIDRIEKTRDEGEGHINFRVEEVEETQIKAS